MVKKKRKRNLKLNRKHQQSYRKRMAEKGLYQKTYFVTKEEDILIKLNLGRYRGVLK